MRVITALVVLAVSLSLNGCSYPNQAVYAEPLLPLLSHSTKARRVKLHPLPARKPQVATKARLVKPPLPPVRKSPEEPTKVSSLRPPPLPLRKPSQAQSPMPSSVSPSASVPPPEEAGEGRQEVEAKFKAAQAKAKLEGVHTLTREDIEGLSPEQIKELRGY
jgi:hypothetical protein